jgi:hypothetical protein
MITYWHLMRAHPQLDRIAKDEQCTGRDFLSVGESYAWTHLLLHIYDFYRAPCVMVTMLRWDRKAPTGLYEPYSLCP